MIRILSTLKRTVNAVLRSEQLLAEIRAGIANLGRIEPMLAQVRDDLSLLVETQPTRPQLVIATDMV